MSLTRVGLVIAVLIPQVNAADKSEFTILNPTPIELRRGFNTDRPSKTDSPFTIDAGAFQIESDVATFVVNIDNHMRVRTWIVANTNFKLGLTNWMDLQIFPQFTSIGAPAGDTEFFHRHQLILWIDGRRG